MMKERVSTAIVLDKRRMKKDGTYPVKIRLTWHSKQMYYSINQDLTEKDFESAIKPRPKGKYRDLALYFATQEAKAVEIIKDLTPFSFDAFSKRFRKKGISNMNVFNWFEDRIKSLNQQGKHGTADIVAQAAKSLKKIMKREKVLFQEVTPDWINKYIRIMSENQCSSTTISIYLRQLKVIFNQAINEGVISRELYPFKKVSIPRAMNIKKALSVKEMKKIFDFSSKKRPEQFARDIFVFSYLCNGMNIADMAQLKNRNVSETNICFVRGKTKDTKRVSKPIVAPINDEMINIIERWKQGDSDNDYIFPILTDKMNEAERVYRRRQATKSVNKQLKKIAQKVGIEKPVSTYYARHSFATILKNSGAPIGFISEALGHSDLRVTQNYLDSFEDKQRAQYQSRLMDWD